MTISAVLGGQIRFSLIAFIFLTASARALAADPSCPDPAIRLSVLLMPPPQQESAHTKAELQELWHLQASRTPDQVLRAKSDDHRTVGRFLDEIGIKVGQLSPSTNHFFDCIADSVREAVHEAKTTFVRTRPYRLPHNNLPVLKKLS